MSSECIVTQVHVPDFDVQGSLPATDKLKLVEFGLEHLRAFNSNAYLILTGHGYVPAKRCLDLCDHVDWNPVSEPLNEHGYVVGMPAQFKYVSRGLEHAKKRGFQRVLKTRGDCIIGVSNAAAAMNAILDSESRQLLITQQTGDGRIGDCYLGGDTELMCHVWDANNPVYDPCGLVNTAHNLRSVLGEWGDLKPMLRRVCAFRDVHVLKFMCLRWNYRALNCLDEATRERLLDPAFDFAAFHWGLANGWHRFDADGNMTSSANYFWSQRGFYEGS